MELRMRLRKLILRCVRGETRSPRATATARPAMGLAKLFFYIFLFDASVSFRFPGL